MIAPAALVEGADGSNSLLKIRWTGAAVLPLYGGRCPAR
jgi:hypothetical protein